MKYVAIGAAVLLVIGLVALFVTFKVLTRDLPDHTVLAKYEPPVTTRVHAGDGKLIAEYSREHRIFVPIQAIPANVQNAFVSAEDKTFRSHGGVDYMGVTRAIINNVINVVRGSGGLQGGSTITQQVAKNMVINDRSQNIVRKVRELEVAWRLEKAFTKDQILELYLNEIYLGGASYGVASAALNYFNKTLDELTLAESAMLAALAQRPGSVNPFRRPERADIRRDWVLSRMVVNGYISEEQARIAQQEPLITAKRLKGEEYAASAYFVEDIRRDALKLFGEDALYYGGLSIRSTIDTRLQLAAQRALRDGLEAHDYRMGWRGATASISASGDWQAALKEMGLPKGADADWELAVVSRTSDGRAELQLLPIIVDEVAPEDVLPEEAHLFEVRKGTLQIGDVNWAREKYIGEEKDYKGLAEGDVVYVTKIEAASKNEATTGALKEAEKAEAEEEPSETEYRLRQIPLTNGAIMAMDPHTGRILAMIGGYSFQQSQFNRVTQAERQPGSVFKPFVYAAALDQGMTPASLILDAPYVNCDENREGEVCYSPGNYAAGKFYGLSTIRLGIEKSRNVMTVRLAEEVGMEPIAAYGERFKIYDKLHPYPANALGSTETTLMRMTTAYSMLVNGGKEVVPSIIDRVQDRKGRTVYKRDARPCYGCNEGFDATLPPPELIDMREQVIDPVTAYQSVSMLEGVVQRGTATRVKAVNKPLAGKTGTTNDYVDAWFVGFSPDLTVGIYVGYDTPKTLGEGEAGGRVAAPIFRDFMQAALKDADATPFRIPSGVRLVAIDAKTGELPGPETGVTILEAFKPGTEPLPKEIDTGSGLSGLTGLGFGHSTRVDDTGPAIPDLPVDGEASTDGTGLPPDDDFSISDL